MEKEIFRRHGWGSNIQPIDTGPFQLLNGIDEGTGPSQRVGRRIKLKSLSLNYYLSSPVTLTATDLLRVMVVRDKDCNGSIFTLGDLLLDSSTGFGIISQYNPDNLDRFHVYYDQVQVVASLNGVNGQVTYKNIQFPINDAFTTFSGSGSTVSDISTNSIYLILIGSQSSASVTSCLINNLRWYLEYIQ